MLVKKIHETKKAGKNERAVSSALISKQHLVIKVSFDLFRASNMKAVCYQYIQ